MCYNKYYILVCRSPLIKESYLKRINEYIERAEKVKDYMKNEKSC